MSKKDKSKFRKRIKAELLKEMAVSQSEVTDTPSAAPINQAPQITASPKIIPEEKAPDALAYIKYDLKKSAIIIGSIIVIIIGLSVWDSKTNVLAKAGSQVFKVLNINNQ